MSLPVSVSSWFLSTEKLSIRFLSSSSPDFFSRDKGIKGQSLTKSYVGIYRLCSITKVYLQCKTILAGEQIPTLYKFKKFVFRGTLTECPLMTTVQQMQSLDMFTTLISSEREPVYVQRLPCDSKHNIVKSELIGGFPLKTGS